MRQPKRVITALVVATMVAALPASGAIAAPAYAETELDRFVASLEGGWSGDDNSTPMGLMPFAVLFDWQEDGSLHSRSSLNRETYIDLRFHKDGEGRWILREEAGMEGLGVQAYSLVPAGEENGLRRWVYAENPEFLTIDVGVREQTLLMDVQLRGEPHVSFKLDRLPDEVLPEVRRQMQKQAEQSPQEGTSIHEVVSGEPGLASIAEARHAVADRPEDAAARLRLAQALGAAIDENPMANGPRFAFEMLQSLQQAIELDPALTEAYHWLAGYYLEAPPIAGGSIDKAEEVARRLAGIAPEEGEALLARVAERRTPPAGDSR